MQKRNRLCPFDNAKPEGYIHLTAFKMFYMVNNVQHRLLDMIRDEF